MRLVFLGLAFFVGSAAFSVDLVLRSSEVLARFVPHKSGVHFTSFKDNARNVEFTANGSALFRIDLEDAQGQPSSHFNVEGWDEVTSTLLGHSRVRLVFRKKELTVTYNAKLLKTKLIANLKVDLSGAYTLKKIHYPYFQAGPVGINPADNFVHYPQASGIVEPRPWDRKIQFQSIPYPSGLVSYQMAGIYGATTGLYVATHDPTAFQKNIDVVTLTEGKEILFDFGWVPAAGTRSIELPGEQIIGVERGDWYDAAQVYRRWAKKKAPWWPTSSQLKKPSRKALAEIPFWIEDTCEPNSPCIDPLCVPRACIGKIR